MKQLHKIFLFLFACGVVATGNSSAQASVCGKDTVVTFRFVPGDDMFYIPWAGNDTELNRLFALVDEYRAEITGGKMPIHVNGYSTGAGEAPGPGSPAGGNVPLRGSPVGGTPGMGNPGFKIVVTRSNRVKSELITHKGLAEEHFITRNHATAYNGQRNIVVVTLRVPAGNNILSATPSEGEQSTSLCLRHCEAACCRSNPDEELRSDTLPDGLLRVNPRNDGSTEGLTALPESPPAGELGSGASPAPPSRPYRFAVRTNLLYDAFLLPTLGVEWRVNPSLGVKLDGSFAWWGSEHGKVQKIWLVNPEVRWYLGGARRLYAGAFANLGQYNIYNSMIGKVFSNNTGYQGTLWGVGLTAGYQLYLSRSFSVDFNLGLGYTRLDYDSFNMPDNIRTYKEKNAFKNFWGPTQAGVSLVWTLGK